ncbi:MAG TPA: hypothetical protein VGQ03_00625 [Nitrososphaera sp.]|nr:hypothetical protein [Nitrososphaera sp.]
MVRSLTALKPFVSNPKSKKQKYCSTCGSLATIEALFDVGDDVTIIEKYCDACSQKISSQR